MTKQSGFKRILEHADRDEILSKIIISIPPKDIHDWLAAKYSNPAEKSLVVSEKMIKDFRDNYLDMYSMIQQDLSKTKNAIATNSIDDLQLSVQGSITYKNRMLELADQEIDIKRMITNAIVAIETRAAQIFDEIQADPRNVNSKMDRVLIEWFDQLGGMLEKYNKIVNNVPDQVIQHNISVQVIDQHISAFHDVVKDILSQLDLESSLLFMEIFNERMSKLKAPSEKQEPTSEMKLAEVKMLNETINKKINA